MSTSKITDIDLYGIMEIDITATAADVRRAYRKKALHCHPDKNPDPKAAELFQKLTKALEILLDEAARAQYDNLLKAKEAAKLRNNALNAKRRKLKDELEEREKAAASFVPEEDRIKNEIEKLRKDGERLVQEEIRQLQEEVLMDLLKVLKKPRDVSLCQLKVTWSEKASEEYLYTKEKLEKIFSKYGDIAELVVLKHRALIEFQDPKAADLAVKIEVGFVNSPLKVAYADKKHRNNRMSHNKSSPFQSETVAQRNQRQADERKKLIEEMLKQDADEI